MVTQEVAVTARMTKDIRLGRLELQIMNAVWERGQASVHEVKDALGSGRTPAYSTVLTMMRKLEAKGYLAHETRGRMFVYRPVLEKREARRSLLGALVDRLFGGSPAQLVNSLVEDGHISGKELVEIRRILGRRSG
jgi:BlaI family transcriptional regulator, penicillinase repressor